MTRLVLTRLALSVVLIFVSTLTVFVLMALVPGDPARTILGANATPDSIAYLREQLGLNQPLYEQYISWVGRAFTGDLGKSIFSGESVTSQILGRLPVTLSLMVLSTIVVTVVGGAFGILSAVRGGALGRVLDAVSLVGLALPSFWVAVVLVGTFAVAIRIFPATGFVPITQDPRLWLLSLILPVAALSLGGVTLVAKQSRDSALDVLSRDYIRVLRAAGVSESAIVFKHVLRNASLPSLTVIGLTLVGALTGTVFVENVFVLPGLGSLATQATATHDLPVVLGVGVFFTLFVIIVNLVIDILYGILNPKVRLS